VIPMPGGSRSAAASVAERIRGTLATGPILTKPDTVVLTASFGVCEVTVDREFETVFEEIPASNCLTCIDLQ